jgi:hypothetical protein
MSWRRCAGSLASVSAASMPGCTRSSLSRTVPKRKPTCVGTSSGSSPRGDGSMARRGSTLNYAGRGGGTAGGTLSVSCARWAFPPSWAAAGHRAPLTAGHDLPIAPNRLQRSFIAERPDQVWLADTSYIPTGEGWLYLAAIKDMATCDRRLVDGRSPEGHGLAALESAQYASGPYREVLERHGIIASMSRRGDCLDNAPMESFFASLKKKEHVHQGQLPNPRGGQGGGVRLRRNLLQSTALTFAVRPSNAGAGARRHGNGRHAA